MTAPNIVLLGMKVSGHTHRVELLLGMLELPYRFGEVSGAERTSPAFLAMNPLAEVPVLQDGELTLADSNAILVYLARRYAPDSDWLPADPVGAARVQRWLSIAAGELRFGPARLRAAALFDRPIDPGPPLAIAEKTFVFMDRVLQAGSAFLAADHPTLSDLACYAYVAWAPEGGVSLTPYPALRGWLERVEALPRFTPMPWTRLPAL
ncbi:MAG: glutathione S-transferase family protein [Roseiarcus sp.]